MFFFVYLSSIIPKINVIAEKIKRFSDVCIRLNEFISYDAINWLIVLKIKIDESKKKKYETSSTRKQMQEIILNKTKFDQFLLHFHINYTFLVLN